MTPSVRQRLHTCVRSAERFLAAFGLGALIYLSFFDLSIVISGSMSPALQGNNPATGDRILFEKLTGRLRAPRRWEIHQFHTPEGLTVAKRIVGLPGERVSIRAGALWIDGKPMPFPEQLNHLRYYPLGNLDHGNEFLCGSGYYVLGDDSRDSNDSRFEGVFTVDRFTARAWLILGPTRFGFVR